MPNLMRNGCRIKVFRTTSHKHEHGLDRIGGKVGERASVIPVVSAPTATVRSKIKMR